MAVQTLGVDDPLEGSLDLEGIMARCPRSTWVKGMFFIPHATTLESEFQSLAKRLVEPPRLGKYLPFNNYAELDYILLSALAAFKRFPECSQLEAIRRAARQDIQNFSESVIGRVTLAAVRDAKALLLMLPQLYQKMANVTAFTAEDRGARRVYFRVPNVNGTPHYFIGQIEGCIQHFKHDSRIQFDLVTPHSANYDVAW